MFPRPSRDGPRRSQHYVHSPPRQDTETAYAVHENAFATRRLHESNGERFRALPLAFL